VLARLLVLLLQVVLPAPLLACLQLLVLLELQSNLLLQEHPLQLLLSTPPAPLQMPHPCLRRQLHQELQECLQS
jgi:hypothetical protein